MCPEPWSFSAQTCPTFDEQRYLYVPSSSNVTTLEEFVANLENYPTVCVNGIPGGGFETSCQNSFVAYGGNFTCRGSGTGAAPFDALAANECQAVWGGIPTADQAALLNKIPFIIYSPVTYFRARDLPPSDPFIPARTSLEIAITKAFEYLALEGVWFEILGGLFGITPASSCDGEFRYWPTPVVEAGSDLEVVIQRKAFRW